LAMVAGLALVP